MLYSIQIYRALAASAVVVFHLNPRVLPLGWVGVDMFFVVSGLIMGTVGLKEQPREFLSKRLIRIVPLYWAATMAIALLALTTTAFNTYKFHWDDLLRSLLFFPFVGYNGLIQPIIRPGWTLNFEMFFYVTFAIGLSFKKPLIVCFTAITSLCILGYVFSPLAAPLQLWTAPLMIEFLLGLLISQIRFGDRIKVALAVTALGILFLIIGFSVGENENNIGIARVITFGFPFALLMLGSTALERAGVWPRIPLLEHLGDISYSLYLLHATVLAATVRFAGNGLVGQTMGILLSIGVAEASFRFFERPSRKYLQEFLRPRSRPLPA
ncbi:exopolysaccharide production protein ExoZ [Rhizobium sp. BK376]|nr:exopolysaccharide production protein ExoZ [Rhizobium sp. BK376]